MPRTSARKRPEGGFVELAPGITIPTDFTGSNQLVSGGTYTVHIRTDPVEKEPRVASFTLTFEAPPTVSELADEQIKRLAGVEIAIASAKTAIDGQPFVSKLSAGDPALWAEALQERTGWHREHAGNVKQLLQGRRGRPERTDESKLEILRYWEANGIAETMERFGLAERTVRRYIADAKKVRGQ